MTKNMRIRNKTRIGKCEKMWKRRNKMRRNEVERTIREIKENKYKMGTRKAVDDTTTNRWKGQTSTGSTGIKKTK